MGCGGPDTVVSLRYTSAMRGPVAALVLLSGVALAQQVQSRIQPQYSEEARIAGLEGQVVVSAVVSSDGTLGDFSIVQPLGLGLEDQAIQALQQAPPANGYPPGVRSNYPVKFTLPLKGSRWHLVRIAFKTPEGASRPTFASANYPRGPGITLAAYEEGRLLSAIKRAAYATISFDIDEHGEPGNFDVLDESEKTWGPEAAALVRNWRFHPGTQNGTAIKVSCEVSFVWGPTDPADPTIAEQLSFFSPPAENFAAAGPAAPRATPRPSAVVEDVTQPQPEYSDAARNAGIEGIVWMNVTVDEAGVPQNPTVTLGFDSVPGSDLTLRAVNAVKAWRFPQVLLNGQPMARKASVRIEFNLTAVRSTIFWPTN